MSECNLFENLGVGVCFFQRVECRGLDPWDALVTPLAVWAFIVTPAYHTLTLMGGKLLQVIEITICNIRILCSQRYAMCVCVCCTPSLAQNLFVNSESLNRQLLIKWFGPKNVLCIFLFYQCVQSSLTILTSFITVVAYSSSGLVVPWDLKSCLSCKWWCNIFTFLYRIGATRKVCLPICKL